MTKIVTAQAFEIESNVYTVVAGLGGGKAVYHVGHDDGRYFTQDQAERLAARVNAARVIDLSHWSDGRYVRDEYALIEAEYYEG